MLSLDTSTAIAIINGRPPACREHLLRRLDAGATLVLSVIALHELRYGASKSQQPERSQAKVDAFLAGRIGVVEFEAEDARRAGALRATLERAGTPIGPFDLLIAAQALRLGAAVVTDNRREFARVPGLAVESWHERD